MPFPRADDEIRTRDPHLGKVMLYQLSHIRVSGRNLSSGPLAPGNALRRCGQVRWSAGRRSTRSTRTPSSSVPRRVADDREVHEVGVGLSQERLALLPRHRRQRAACARQLHAHESGQASHRRRVLRPWPHRTAGCRVECQSCEAARCSNGSIASSSEPIVVVLITVDRRDLRADRRARRWPTAPPPPAPRPGTSSRRAMPARLGCRSARRRPRRPHRRSADASSVAVAAASSTAESPTPSSRLAQRRLQQLGLRCRPPRRVVAQVVEPAGQIAGQHREVDRDGVHATIQHERSGGPVQVDHPHSLVLAGCLPAPIAHHLERAERRRLGLGAAPPPDGEQRQRQPQDGQPAGGQEDPDRRLVLGQLVAERSGGEGRVHAGHRYILAHLGPMTTFSRSTTADTWRELLAPTLGAWTPAARRRCHFSSTRHAATSPSGKLGTWIGSSACSRWRSWRCWRGWVSGSNRTGCRRTATASCAAAS